MFRNALSFYNNNPHHRTSSTTTTTVPLLIISLSCIGLIILPIPSAESADLARVERHIVENCAELSILLRPLCAGMTSPHCCTLFAIVDACSMTCNGGGVGVGAGSSSFATRGLSVVLQDGSTCPQLQMVGRSVCGAASNTTSCLALRCLVHLLCLDGTTTCDQPSPPEVSVAARNENRRQQHSRTFDFPEMAACEATNLVPFDRANVRECPPTINVRTCGSEYVQYRSTDGRCNNLLHPNWGRSFQPPKRLIPADYDDADGFPRVHGLSGRKLQSARLVSRYVSPETSVHSGHSVMVMAWGQFIDHDFTGFPVIKKNNTDIKCCVPNLDAAMLVDNGGPCFPISVAPDDDFFKNKSGCMEFVRSRAADTEAGTFLSPREQVNGLTSYIDASTVYGSTDEDNKKLRGPGGKLIVSANNMLPPSNKSNCKIVNNSTDYCLNAGDHRVNVFVGLQVFHTVFHRLHNQLVDGLAVYNKHWDDEKLYQEARKIVAALHQHITYNEYLPSCLDDATMDKYRLWPGDYRYNQSVQADMSNVFSTAAFRFGHSQVQPIVKVGKDRLKVENTLMRPHWALTRFDDAVTGMASGFSEDVDHFFVEGLTDRMFERNPLERDGLDLVSLNVQRGRDHGLPSYNEYRKFCGLEPVTTFTSLVFKHSIELSHVYEQPNDIDVFIGGVLEHHIPGGVIGPLFSCLIGQQFHDMKFGDRFWYETPRTREGFTPAQLQEIKTQTLASVLCSTTGVRHLQRDLMFVQRPFKNPWVKCNKTPRMDLALWAEVQ